MLTAEQNDLLTRIGPGTPCGELMRRYWHPIAAVSELDGLTWNKRVRLLGEELVLSRDKQGRYGLITESCPHMQSVVAMPIALEFRAVRSGLGQSLYRYLFYSRACKLTGQCHV